MHQEREDKELVPHREGDAHARRKRKRSARHIREVGKGKNHREEDALEKTSVRGGSKKKSLTVLGEGAR